MAIIGPRDATRGQQGDRLLERLLLRGSAVAVRGTGGEEYRQEWARRIWQRCFVLRVAMRGNGTLQARQAAVSCAAAVASPNMTNITAHPFERQRGSGENQRHDCSLSLVATLSSTMSIGTEDRKCKKRG